VLTEIENGHYSACLFSADADFVQQFENRVSRDGDTGSGS